jgi:hypothetical protein
MRTHQYDLKYRLISSAMSIIWCSVLILVFYGGIRETHSHLVMSAVIESSGFLWTGLAIIWLIMAIIAVSCLLALAGSLTMFSGITVGTDGFKVHNRIGSTQWLDWQSIHKARPSPFGNFWFLGIKGLGPLYWPNGFIWWLGAGGIQISRHIGEYNELMKVLREKRPDILNAVN